MFSAILASAAVVSTFAMAQNAPDATVPGHPRVNEVNQRLNNQQNRIQKGVADGQINPKQESRDEKQDSNIAQREGAGEAKHNGHLTKGEQKRLNHDSRHIHRQRH